MSGSHLSLDELEPGTIGRLPPEARRHLEGCPRCRIEARMLAAALAEPERATELTPPQLSAPLEHILSLRLTSALGTGAATQLELDAPPESPAAALARYPRKRCLGTGPRGVSFEVLDAILGVPRTLKLLRPPDGGAAEALRPVVDRVVALRHVHVARIYAFHLAEPPFYLITDLLAGPDALAAVAGEADWRRPGSPPVAQAEQVRRHFGQVALGLKALHDAGVVHGNLKPPNLLLDERGRVVLLDAGLYLLAPAPSRYEAPEVGQGALPSFASDWYAVGALLWEALTGLAPPGPGPALTETLPGRSGPWEGLEALCVGLMNADPRRRVGPGAVFDALGVKSLDPYAVTQTSAPQAPRSPKPASPVRTELPIQRPLALGPYRIDGLLARGGMGVVYRGTHRTTGAAVAIKTVPVARRRLMAGIRREIATLSRIRHPGVITILDHGAEGDLPWYAMPLIEGAVLTDMEPARRWREEVRCGQGRWGNPDLRAALAVLRDTCAPLSHLHAAGLVHRDLKPDNILVSAAGVPVLVDFGLALSVAGELNREVLELHPGMEGTIPYMAPEQIRAESADARADLYSLGCILYELVAGRRPFSGAASAEILYQHLVEPPRPIGEFVDGLPAQLSELISNLLEKLPDKRPGYADVVGRQLGEIIGEPSPWAGPAPVPQLYRATLVGREAALAGLDVELSQLLRGEGGSLVLLGGETGSGKTRLANEWLRRIRDRGVQVLIGGAHPPHAAAGGALHPFRPVLVALAEQARELDAEAGRALLGPEARVLATYESVLGELPAVMALPEPHELSPREARLRTLLALSRVFGRWAARRPIVLVIDDIQWADELTLAWLALCARTARGTGLMQLALYRSEESTPAIDELRASAGVRHVSLERLAEAGVEDMLRSMLAMHDPPADLVAWLVSQSEGNPLFVAEYVRTAVSEGLLTRDEEGRWRLAEGQTDAERLRAIALPTSLAALIQRRLDQLDPAARRLTEWAAVLGQELSPELLDSLVEGASSEAMAELVRREVLEDTESGGLRFTHDRIREVAYGLIEAAERAILHRGCALALSNAPDAGAWEASCGWHWEMAGEPSRARPQYLGAASKAWGRGDLEEASRLYAAYLQLVETPTPESAQVRNQLARVLLDRGRTREALEESRRAHAEAGAVGERREVGRSLLVSAEARRILGEARGAMAELEEAGEIFRAIGDEPEEARRLSRLATVQTDLGRPREALLLLQQALDIQRRIGDRREEGITLNRLAGIHHLLGQLDEAASCVQAALEAHRAAGNRHSEAVAEQILALGLQTQGHFEPARELLEHAVVRLREVGDRRFEGLTLNALAVGHLLEGDDARAQVLFDKALRIAEEVGSRWSLGVSLTHLAAVHAQRGDADGTERCLEDALAIHEKQGNRLYEYYTLLELAGARRRRGDLAGAEGSVVRAEAVGAATESPFCETLLACERGHLALSRGEDAQPWLDEASRLLRGLRATPRSQLGRAVQALAAAMPPAPRCP